MILAQLTFLRTPLGWLIYAAMAAMAVAFLLLLFDRRRAGGVAFALGFAAALTAVVVRTVQAQHVPLQSMFEVFLVMGALCWPLSMIWKRLGVTDQTVDPLLAAAILFPAGFVFSPVARVLPPALQSPLFLPHVLAYLTSYVILTKAGLEALAFLLRPILQVLGIAQPQETTLDRPAAPLDRLDELHRLVLLAMPLMTLGLLLGAVWGKSAYGRWWNWDPKEDWSLCCWLIYAVHLHLYAAWGPKRRRRLQAAVLVVGLAAIVITLLWVSLATGMRSQHSYT